MPGTSGLSMDVFTALHGKISNFVVEQESRTGAAPEWSPSGPEFSISAGLTTQPQTRLRKKPKALHIASSTSYDGAAHMRRVSGIPKTLSYPTFHSEPSEPDSETPRPSSSPSASRPSLSLIRAQSSGSIIKRRPPASHSSYGVETSLGPPPSYSTQRTLSEDRVWSVNRSRTVTTTTIERVTPLPNEGKTPQQQSPQSPTAPAEEDLTAFPIPQVWSDLLETSELEISSPETFNTPDTQTTAMTPPTSSDETQKSEDLFLNIARADSKPEKRSRISLPFFSNPRAADERSHVGSVSDRRELRSRRHSNANDDTPRPPTRSYTSRTTRLVSENLHGLKTAEQPATESTISTTAPSTVWDELDDLKSRIKKLELTGKLPLSSAAAMGTTERPRTATTQATTMSSSPRHKPSIAMLPSQIEGISNTVHPLLHEALNNAKTVVSSDVYQKLQATAQDALQLSAMMNHEGYTGPTSAMSPTNERQIRRRTESMCRSLTELAIAMLADSKSVNTPIQRPGSRGAYASPNPALRSRQLSNDPSERPPVTSRVQSRLESRRTSLNTAQTHSPAATFETPPTPASVLSVSSRAPRTSTVLGRSRRHPSYLDGTNDDEESPTIRPVSRARTEVNVPASSSQRDRATFSRQYTRQHPLPTQFIDVPPVPTSRTPLPSNVNIVSRRNASHATPLSAPSYTSLHRQFSDEPSPITPSQRPPFTISVSRHASATESPTTVLPETPDSATSAGGRQTSTRRSLGFASRISNVSSRLKAARAERLANTSASRSPPRDGTGEGASILDRDDQAAIDAQGS